MTSANRLLHESSPYLLQHAHNPVQWYPWGEEALQKAKAENKVILVSIGYAACHWCHVMERESFEDEATAGIMNAHFINIKIDREERPDLDHIYMDAVQAMTGSGGWPLNVFLTPDARPFYGGTYFPPVRAFNRASWTEVLQSIQKAWTERTAEILEQAATLTGHLEKANEFGISGQPDAEGFTMDQCHLMFDHIMKNADTRWGGFGKAPKFPQTFTIQYLLQYYHFTREEAALQQARLSIDKMLDGGIYDHVGGGLSRYSTDEEWLAPHFEKMLYDNALLLNVLADAFAITQLPKYEQAIRHIIAFLQRELQDAEGGFYAALDADSEGEEGKFYVWQKEEVEALLGKDADLFCTHFDITGKGNWEHTNILRVLRPLEETAAQYHITAAEAAAVTKRGLDILLAAREKRVRPLTDDKILLGWNALLVTALCKTSAALKEESFKDLAVSTMDFLLEKFAGSDGAFYHTYKNGVAKYPAFLDDYSYLVQALVHLQEVTSDTGYLQQAKTLTTHIIAHFEEPSTGYFFFTGDGQQDVIVRKKEVYDGATPSGNSIMAENLFYLSVVFNEPGWSGRANASTAALQAAIVKYPSSFAVWASAILKQVQGLHEIAVVGPGFSEKRAELLGCFIPGRVFQSSLTPDNAYPLLAGKKNSGETLIYHCRQYACQAPVQTAAELLSLLENAKF